MKSVLNLKERNNNILLLAIIFSLGIGAIFELGDAVIVFIYCIIGEEGYTWSEEIPYILEIAVWASIMMVAALMTVLAAKKKCIWMVFTVVLLAGLTVYSVSTLFLNCLILAIVWLWNEKRKALLSNNKLLTVGIVLAAISSFDIAWVILYGLSAELEWLLLNLSLQLFVFVLKPEMVVMIYLFKNSKKKELGYKKVRVVTIVYFVLWTMLVAVMLFANLTDSGVISGWFGDFGGADVEAGDWSEWTTEDDVSYGTDSDGNVTFEMEAEDVDGKNSTYQIFEFE